MKIKTTYFNHKPMRLESVLLASTLAITGCGGETAEDSIADTISSFNLTSLSAANTSDDGTSGAIRQLSLTWGSALSDASSTDITYTVCQTDESQDDNCAALASVTNQTSTTVELASLIDAVSSSYFVMASDGTNTVSSSEMSIDSDTLTEMIGYFKASNTYESAAFGNAIALSSDGNTLAVASYYEGSASTGIDGEDSYSSDDNYSSKSGAVYVFEYEDGAWSQTAYIKAPYAEEQDRFGSSLSLSADGSTLAVGAPFEDSSATGIDGDESDNEGYNSGAVYIYSHDDSGWAKEAYVKASNTVASDVAKNAYFGGAVALSADGETLAVGSYGEASSGSGVSGEQSQEDGNNFSGAVYIFRYDDSAWTQEEYIKAAEVDSYDQFGYSVALDEEGNTLVVGAWLEDSAATGIDGDDTDDTAASSGAAYVFSYEESSWTQSAYLKASNTEKTDKFGSAVTIDDSGTLVAVSAPGEDSAATGIDGEQAEDSDSETNYASSAGAVYVFALESGSWSQTTYVKASNTEASDNFGQSIALSGDGSTLAVSANKEDSAAKGFNGEQTETETDEDEGVEGVNFASGAGAVYLFELSNSVWSQTQYVKASNSGEGDQFGSSVALTTDGSILGVGAQQEESASTGINGVQTETEEDEDAGTEAVNFADKSGAVYLY